MARTKFSASTFNLYNLNKPGEKIYFDTDGWPQDQYDLKVKWSANMVNMIGADVFGFQELWHEEALQEVFELSGIAADYELLIPQNHRGGKIVCAAAVKRSIYVSNSAEWVTNFPEKFHMESGGDDPQTPDISVNIKGFSRPVLKFKIKPRSDGEEISIYVAHFKSKAPTQLFREGWYKDDNEYYKRHSEALGAGISTIRRTAEATALRMILTEEMKGTDTPVMVLGDLNDGQHSNTLNILTGQPNYLLYGYSKGGSDNDLYTTGTLQEYRSLRDVYYTHIHQNNMESLDHILVSQEFYDNSRKRLWSFKGLEVFNDHLNRDDHKETGTNDHGIIKATFEYRPAK